LEEVREEYLDMLKKRKARGHMGRIHLFRCDKCKKVKGPGYHWWVISYQGSCITIAPLDENMDLTGTDDTLCGEACLLKKVSEFTAKGAMKSLDLQNPGTVSEFAANGALKNLEIQDLETAS
jgi:hypothetical protein